MSRFSKLMTGLLIVVALAALGVAAVSQAAAPPKASSFYDGEGIPLRDAPGELLRTEVIDSEVEGVRLWRMLYRSRDGYGYPTIVSGLFAAPDGPAPTDGYPLVAVGHGTVGVNRGCAPSIDPFRSFRDGPSSFDLFVASFVRAGYAVAMADYQGLGVAGASSYLAGEVTGQNILDSARAIRSFTELPIADEYFIWGQSQGGHAALFAGAIAPEYAPELTLVGIAAEAPAGNLSGIFDDLVQRDQRGGVVALTLMGAQAWALADDTVDLTDILTRRGLHALNSVVEDVCLMPAILATQLARPSDLLRPDALAVLEGQLQANEPPFGPYGVPVFIAHGDADIVIPEPTNAMLRDAMCEAGTSLTYRVYAGAGHLEIVHAAEQELLSWMTSLREGREPLGACA